MQLCFLGMTSAIKITQIPTCTTLNQGWVLDLGPETKSQKAAPKHCTICDMSFAQYMVLTKGPCPYFCSHYIKKGPLYFIHATQKF